MFSSIWSGITNAASSIGNTISSWFGGGGNQSANALQGTYIPGSYNPNYSNPQATSYSPGGTTYYNGYVPPGGSSTAGQMDSGNNMSATTISAGGGGNFLSQALSNISAGQQSYGSSGGYSNQAQNLYQTYYKPQPTTISAKNLNLSSPTYGGAGSVSASGSSPLVLPNQSSAASTNPRIDTTGLAGSMAGFYTRNADGSFTQVKDTTDNSNDKIINDVRNLYGELGVKPTVAEDPEVMQARQQRQRIQQSLLAPTAELNAVIAKQHTDLLAHRKMVSEGGGTETGFGGIESAINYNAAIRALPLQAQISSLQGDLKLAQDYLSELTQIKQEQIDNQYNFRASMLKSVEDKIDKRDQRVYEEMKTANERAYQMNRDNVKFQDDWQMLAAKNGDGSMAKQIAMLNPSAPNFRQKLGEITGGLSNMGVASKTGGGVLSTLPTSIQGKVISIADGFGSKPNIRKYIEAVDSVNIVNGIDPKSKNPADHQQIIYAFAKALDPDSAVKEGEYETIRKYAQSAFSRYKKEITNAINGTGFLSEGAIRNIQTTMMNTLNSRKSVYQNTLNDTKKIINNIAGSNVADDIMMDYDAGRAYGNNMQEVTITPDDNALFNSIVMPRTGTQTRSDIPSNNPLSGGNLLNASPFFRLFR